MFTRNVSPGMLGYTDDWPISPGQHGRLAVYPHRHALGSDWQRQAMECAAASVRTEDGHRVETENMILAAGDSGHSEPGGQQKDISAVCDPVVRPKRCFLQSVTATLSETLRQLMTQQGRLSAPGRIRGQRASTRRKEVRGAGGNLQLSLCSGGTDVCVSVPACHRESLK
ncbi:hypothetical protein DPEC_G00228220 [Dallia pectoralis]|uniref:Uncharacterized protein n=1 Tax=Dallia pectoralis TaxID=75939 RepID=A0ACC2G1H2_DALPE|nr:hypothetical protein DPEC_G00228220 [Dallia pectoralis]